MFVSCLQLFALGFVLYCIFYKQCKGIDEMNYFLRGRCKEKFGIPELECNKNLLWGSKLN